MGESLRKKQKGERSNNGIIFIKSNGQVFNLLFLSQQNNKFFLQFFRPLQQENQNSLFEIVLKGVNLKWRKGVSLAGIYTIVVNSSSLLRRLVNTSKAYSNSISQSSKDLISFSTESTKPISFWNSSLNSSSSE